MDYVLATGRTVSIRDFVNMAFAEVGRTLEWKGSGVDEVGICTRTGQPLVQVDPRYFRPAEVDLLVGDASKAKRVLGWEPKYTLEECAEMVASDLDLFKRTKYLRDGGHSVFTPQED